MLRIALMALALLTVAACNPNISSPIDSAGNCYFEPWRPNC